MAAERAFERLFREAANSSHTINLLIWKKSFRLERTNEFVTPTRIRPVSMSVVVKRCLGPTQMERAYFQGSIGSFLFVGEDIWGGAFR